MANPSKSCERRLIKELNDLRANPIDGCSATPVRDDNLLEWSGTIIGPQGTPYEDGTFILDIQVPPDYPFHPPRITFVTKIYHPNVDDTGSICLDILAEGWCSALTINKTVLSLCSYLDDPDPDGALVPEIAHLYKTDRVTYDQNARDWTKQYAMGT